MKKILLVWLTLECCSTIVQAKQPSKPTDFSGNWVLSFGQTKNPPAGLQHYSMLVNQDEQQLKSPEGSGTVHLVFLKTEADSSSGASPQPQ